MPYRFCESAKDGENRFEFRYGPKKKKVSEACIQMGLEEIDEEEYLHILKQLLEKKKDLAKENNQFVRKKKMVDYVVRKGYESDLVWEVVHNL